MNPADPQQRLLLEVSWEAFERAGIDPLSMKGSQAGVHVGVMNPDHPARPDTVLEAAVGFLVTGVDSSVASGRVAYVLGPQAAGRDCGRSARLPAVVSTVADGVLTVSTLAPILNACSERVFRTRAPWRAPRCRT